MTHLLDMNICSAHIKRPGGLAHRFSQYAGRLAVPTIAMAEWPSCIQVPTNTPRRAGC